MKTKLVLIISIHLLYILPATSINQYKAGDSLYVWAKSGLSLRVAPDIKSEKIKSLPFGTMVIPQSGKYLFMEEDQSFHVLEAEQFEQGKNAFKGIEIHGQWVKVKVGTEEGYIFDGYLSTLEVPITPEHYGFLNYLKRTLSIKELIEKTAEHEVGENRIFFEKGIFYRDNAGVGAFDFHVVFADLSFEEGFLIANYFFGGSIKIVRPNKETIEFVDEMGGVTMKYIHQTVIMYGGWSC